MYVFLIYSWGVFVLKKSTFVFFFFKKSPAESFKKSGWPLKKGQLSTFFLKIFLSAFFF